MGWPVSPPSAIFLMDFPALNFFTEDPFFMPSISSTASKPVLTGFASPLDSASAFLLPVGGTFLILSFSPAGLLFSFSTSLARMNGRFAASDGASAFSGTVLFTLSILSMSPDVFFISTSIDPPFLYLRTLPPSFLARPPLRSLDKSVFSPSCNWLSCMPKADLTTFLAVFSSCFRSDFSPSTTALPPFFITLTLTEPPVLKQLIFGRDLNPSILRILNVISILMQNYHSKRPELGYCMAIFELCNCQPVCKLKMSQLLHVHPPAGPLQSALLANSPYLCPDGVGTVPIWFATNQRHNVDSTTIVMKTISRSCVGNNFSRSCATLCIKFSLAFPIPVRRCNKQVDSGIFTGLYKRFNFCFNLRKKFI